MGGMGARQAEGGAGRLFFFAARPLARKKNRRSCRPPHKTSPLSPLPLPARQRAPPPGFFVPPPPSPHAPPPIGHRAAFPRSKRDDTTKNKSAPPSPCLAKSFVLPPPSLPLPVLPSRLCVPPPPSSSRRPARARVRVCVCTAVRGGGGDRVSVESKIFFFFNLPSLSLSISPPYAAPPPPPPASLPSVPTTHPPPPPPPRRPGTSPHAQPRPRPTAAAPEERPWRATSTRPPTARPAWDATLPPVCHTHAPDGSIRRATPPSSTARYSPAALADAGPRRAPAPPVPDDQSVDPSTDVRRMLPSRPRPSLAGVAGVAVPAVPVDQATASAPRVSWV